MKHLLERVTLGCDAHFPDEEFHHRVEQLRKELHKRSLDIYLTTGPENIFYLSG